MAAKREQYDWRGTRSAWRKWKAALKRQTVRWLRREAKRSLEDTPSRGTAGWTR